MENYRIEDFEAIVREALLKCGIDLDMPVRINGRISRALGRCCFRPGDGGTYYQVKENDAKTYQEVGTTTLPLGGKFELLDNANNDNKKLTAQDMTTLKDDGASFNVNNTTATVENGVITNITRAYMP